MLEHAGRLLPQIFLGQAKAIYRKYAIVWISHVAARHDAGHAFKEKATHEANGQDAERCDGNLPFASRFVDDGPLEDRLLSKVKSPFSGSSNGGFMRITIFKS